MTRVKFAIGIGLILSMLTACGSTVAEEEEIVPSATAESIYAETGEITPEIILTILEEEDWSDFGYFTLDKERSEADSRAAYGFTFTDPDMIEFIEMVPDEPSLLDEWHGITGSFDGLGATINELTGLVSSLYIVDPNDPDDMIYISIDGSMIHDMTSE